MDDRVRIEATRPPLAPSDLAMVMAKSRENRLAFATWLIFFRDHGRFPREPSDLATVDTASLAAQIGVSDSTDGGLALAERTAKRLRTEIRARYGFREATVADADQPRLLLCLHGIGTNAGLQRMAGLESGVTAKDLAYVRRRYLSIDPMRRAIAIVTNGTLKVRNPAIWGTATTACASDSKHHGAWDQNLTTQWHVRYGGRGIMIYWHVERNSLCIHSQLKSPSSSEVASMIKGVIHPRSAGCSASSCCRG